MPDQKAIQSKGWAYARRSQRVLMRVPILVRGRAWDESSFSEVTHTVVVNAHGALIMLAMDVRSGQELLVGHQVSGKDIEGRVVNVEKKEANKAEVGITFLHPAPHFWGIDFPPADWKCLPE